jgi:hypothetical protein
VFENRVLRGIFGSKRDGVTGVWRKLLNEDLHNLYCSPTIVRVLKWRIISSDGERKRICRFLVGKPEGNR